MTRLALRAAFAAGVLLLLSPRANAAEGSDLRDIRIGQPISALPMDGYTGLSCADRPSQTLSAWTDYTACPSAADGTRAIRFHYDERKEPLAPINDTYAGTKVGGHPVLLTLGVASDGTIERLTIETDPAARLYMHKKAFLLAELVKQRYGETGWSCEALKPAGAAPVGGVFIDQHCTKSIPGRALTLDQQVFRTPDQDTQHFVSRTQLDIRAKS